MALSSEEFVVGQNGFIPGYHEFAHNLTSHAGRLDIGSSTLKYFFWRFAEPAHDKKHIVFWLNGGPGCSSLDGALLENGPLRITTSGQVTWNTGTWVTRANLVYVDQPGGTGFSLPDYDGTSNDNMKDITLFDIGNQFVEFLDQYFELFPEDIEKKIILAGESYAGQYIPFIADAILRRNDDLDTEKSSFYNLDSLLIGNGWIDPKSQSLSYLPFAIDKGLVDPKITPNFEALLHQHEQCQKDIGNKLINSQFNYDSCESILLLILKHTANLQTKTCTNAYNYMLTDSYPSCGSEWPHELSGMQKLLKRKEVLMALNIKAENGDLPSWMECNSDVRRHLRNDLSTEDIEPSIELLSGIIEFGIDVLLFNGDNDLVCNTKGTMDMIQNLKWNGLTGFTDNTESIPWLHHTGDETNDVGMSGSVKSARGLTFVSVYNASHMVPYDKPMVSRGILDIAIGKSVQVDVDGMKNILTSDVVEAEDYQDEHEAEGEENSESEGDTFENEIDSDGESDKEEDDLKLEETEEDEWNENVGNIEVDNESENETDYPSADDNDGDLVLTKTKKISMLAVFIGVILVYLWVYIFKRGKPTVDSMLSSREQDPSDITTNYDIEQNPDNHMTDGGPKLIGGDPDLTEFDIDDHNNSNETRAKRKGKYTSLNNDDESIELDNLGEGTNIDN